MSKNAVDEFLSMKKTAAPGALGSFGRHAGMAATGALAAGAGAALAGGIGAAVSHIVDAATKSHDFKEMLAANEDLHEHYQADPKRFNMMFSTLRTMNPQFSKDPLVAGTYMRRMVTAPEGIGGLAGEALGHRGEFDHPIQEMFSRGAGEGAKSGLGQSYGQDTGERAWGAKKQELDYAHGLRQQADQGVEEHTTHYEYDDRGEPQTKRLQVKTRNRT